MKLKIKKDRMGYNWLLCTDGLVLAFGAQKSFKTEVDAQCAYNAIAKDLRDGITIGFNVRETIGMYSVVTPDDVPIRFAGLFETDDAAEYYANSILIFMET